MIPSVSFGLVVRVLTIPSGFRIDDDITSKYVLPVALSSIIPRRLKPTFE